MSTSGVGRMPGTAMSRSQPPATATGEVTGLLTAVVNGDATASDRLFPLVYEELRRLARSQMVSERPDQTLQPTALVHEAYLRLVGDGDIRWNSRAHFFGAAALAMRRILVESARRRKQLKRGGEFNRIPLTDAPALAGTQPVDVVALDGALSKLEALDERKSQIVMLRYFAGLTVEQTGAAMDLSPATVKKEWSYARAWLLREMRTGGADPADQNP
jgi:RNA polymerase sigma factor (TIGR02999 family)